MSDKRRRRIKCAIGFAAAVSAISAGTITASAASETAASAEDLLSSYEASIENESEESAASVKGLLGAASDYSVFVHGDFTVYGADCPGNLAVGGTATVPSDYYSEGSTVVGSVAEGSSFHNGSITPEEAGIDFDSEFENLTNLSSDLAKIESNGTVSTNPYWGARVEFTGTNETINVFNLTAEQYSAVASQGGGLLSFDFNVPAGSVVVINITGGGNINLGANCGVTYAGQVVNNGTANNGSILFNVPDAATIIINDSIGSLLAPTSSVTSFGYGNNHFEGQLICLNYNGANEFGSITFDGDKPVEDTLDDLIDPDDGDTDTDNVTEDDTDSDEDFESDTDTDTDTDTD
ncbi:MAG: choice-of-anchor A family protein, partial [Oscillospiraceae bacterium]|nr:choice-of-anchor A family protein [Oscillospiraceae bacterium]